MSGSYEFSGIVRIRWVFPCAILHSRRNHPPIPLLRTLILDGGIRARRKCSSLSFSTPQVSANGRVSFMVAAAVFVFLLVGALRRVRGCVRKFESPPPAVAPPTLMRNSLRCH